MPVQIIAHRGWWKTPDEQNTLVAFARAFDAGIGVELDVRDYNGDLVVSHDPPIFTLDENHKVVGAERFSRILELLGDRPNLLAVNVKSCGLAPWFAKIEKKPNNWFFFDVAPGDDSSYRDYTLPIRYRTGYVEDRQVRISEEIFGRDHLRQWHDFKLAGKEKTILIITDLVPEAMEFFGGSHK